MPGRARNGLDLFEVHVMTEHELTRFIDWLWRHGFDLPADGMRRSVVVREYLAAPRCKFCGDPRPLDVNGHCAVCVAGMERTKED